MCKKIDEEINHLVSESLEKIDLVIQKIFTSNEHSKLYSIETIAKAKISLGEFQKSIFKRRPQLRPPPPKDYIPDREMTEKEKKYICSLSSDKLKKIDNAILFYAKDNYLKVARIVGDILMDKDIHSQKIPDVFYADRIRRLVKKGLLNSQGNLHYMRYSEVKLAKNKN